MSEPYICNKTWDELNLEEGMTADEWGTVMTVPYKDLREGDLVISDAVYGTWDVVVCETNTLKGKVLGWRYRGNDKPYIKLEGRWVRDGGEVTIARPMLLRENEFGVVCP